MRKRHRDNEIERIVALADLDENEILGKIGVTRANWDNAKKILPRFAEQLARISHKSKAIDAGMGAEMLFLQRPEGTSENSQGATPLENASIAVKP